MASFKYIHNQHFLLKLFVFILNSATRLYKLFKYLSNKKLLRILPCQNFHLVLQKKQENPTIDLAKIQIKSERLTPFGGLFSIMEQFDSTLSSIVYCLKSHCGVRGYCRQKWVLQVQIICKFSNERTRKRNNDVQGLSCGFEEVLKVEFHKSIKKSMNLITFGVDNI
ncbi:hypothetical protein DEM91_12170 [Prevotella sp. TCVGH]|nr:hypothetical protein [Prevotella sp. TCVGH]